MKKKWIMEVVYGVVALLFIWICIADRTGRGPIQAVFGTELMPTPEGTPAPDAVPTSEPVMSGAPTEDTTPAPDSTVVKDTIPIPGGQATDPETPSGTPTPEQPSGQEGEAGEKADNTPAPTAEPMPTNQPTPTAAPTPEPMPQIGRMDGAIPIKNENYETYSNEKYSWWFRRMTDHSPSGSGEAFPITEFDAYYLDKEVADEDKVIYITFDCGYENGFTPTILDTLAEKDVKALFFVTESFVKSNPEYVIRMKEEGHLVGNHTVRHLSSPSLTPEELEEELYAVAQTMEDLTGYRIDPFFRPPMGEYSERTLKATQDMGYTSVFWSIAYYDYDTNDQPGKEYVVDHFTTYHHNGSIVLMHNTSESNAQALGDVLDLLKAEGYRFGTLPEVTK